MFAFEVNKKLYARIKDYLDVAEQTIELYRDSMEHYLRNHIDTHLEMMVQKTHEVESHADDIKQEIEQSLYQKSLLPDTRQDIFRLLDSIDRMPNKAESILRRIYTQNICLPKQFEAKVWELVQLGADTFKVVRKAVIDSLEKMERTQKLVMVIDSNESVGDALEQRIIYEIFRSEVEPADRILLRDLVLEIGHILDLAESLSDIITILTIKRQV